MSSTAPGDDAGTATTATSLADVLATHARGYAQAVRLHLHDLDADVVEELTDGLEADLAETLADAGRPADLAGTGKPAEDVPLDLVAAFGPASGYAAELRAAAGFPPAATARPRPSLRVALGARWILLRERWAELWRPVTSTPRWAALRTLGRELRPAWWVLRGWVVGALLVAWFGTRTGPPSLVPLAVTDALIMAGAALVSVQWARGRWLPGRWRHRLTLATSVVAVLAVPAVANATHDQSVFGTQGSTTAVADSSYADAGVVAYDEYGFEYDGDDGVVVEGRQVANLFVYDAQGEPLRDVQVFDDRGRPVRTVPEGAEGTSWTVPDVDGAWNFRPATSDDGRERWNVYPLQAVPEAEMEWTEDGDVLQPQVGTQAEDMPWPFLQAPTAIGERADGAAQRADGDGDRDDGGAEEVPPADDGTPAEEGPAPSPSTEGSSARTADAVARTTAAAERAR
ncbi:hypothetical protein ACH436_08150 [Isoptericola sp. NPDC019693]|uniref:hypothetical protein n=1 Tax=Isoptericola sp. NPDC019693 TaxID=3364009 RepID=UPI00379AA176